ncbi:hypothetical protein [Ramlibacter sp.]|uniref:hypothetical protein n=1 Tax=Ramlibacter sp. TaxID=1917967 RepID=UPI002FC60D17
MGKASTLVALAAFVAAGAGCAYPPGGMGRHAGGPGTGPDHTPGWGMMSQAERDEHHRRMQAARTPEECRQAMDDHRRRMQERARERGMRMPEPRQDACAAMRP